MATLFVYITAPSQAEAEGIGHKLVEERLAAGVNLIPGMRTVYRWQGKVEAAEEVVLIAKTTQARLPALARRVQALHPYEVPCILALPVAGGNPDYLAWIAAESEPVEDPDAAPA